MTASTLRRPMTVKSMRVSTRSSRNFVGDDRPEGGMERLGRDLEHGLRDPRFEGGEIAVVLVGRLLAVAAEQDFHQRKHAAPVEPDEDARVELRRIENGGDAAVIGVERVPHMVGRDRIDETGQDRRRKGPQAFGAGRRQPVEDHGEHRQPLDAQARIVEQSFGRAPRRGSRSSRPWRYAACRSAPPEVVSFSTSSMVGRSLAGMVLRPNSTAIWGMAPFM